MLKHTFSSFVCRFLVLNFSSCLERRECLTDDGRPISTKPRYTNPENKEYIRFEVKRLLEERIVQKLDSPCLCSAQIVRDKKPRMVVDYSETTSLFTKLDVYPLTPVEAVLVENHYFSRLDLKSAYKTGSTQLLKLTINSRNSLDSHSS